MLQIRNLLGAVTGPYDLDLSPGGCAVLTGPSGVGKSLLLRMIADLDPSTGTVTLDGTPREAMKASAWRRKVTYLAAESGWWEDRVIAHFAAPGMALALLPAVGLAPALLEAPVARLSTGERQRLALVRALVQSPRILLLDEPTSALDAETVLLVEQLLAERRAAGTGCIVVTHDAAQAARLGGTRYRVSASGLERLTA